MNINLNQSIWLFNFEQFLPNININEKYLLNINFGERFQSFHPLVYSVIASLTYDVALNGGQIYFNGNKNTIKALKKQWGLDNLLDGKKTSETDGRIIPIFNVSNEQEHKFFLQEIVPLLHCSMSQADPIRYVLSEMIRNVLEHSRSPNGAMVCCFYSKSSNRVSLGIADTGIGVSKSISMNHQVKSNTHSLELALTPGITGTTSKIGGNEYNAGAGLFFTRSIAKLSNNYFVLCSSNGLYKLKNDKNDRALFPNPLEESHLLKEFESEWQGTLVGVDFSLDNQIDFELLLSEIRKAYSIDVRNRKNGSYKKPKFI